MAADKQTFLKNVTVLTDTREQKNAHITTALDRLGVAWEARKLDFGDYSFLCGGRDFSLSCVVERKASINELYGNLSTSEHRARLEREFSAAHSTGADMTLLLENCAGEEELKEYQVPAWEMQAFSRKVQDIGIRCHRVLCSWQMRNRYGFRVSYVRDPEGTAAKMLEFFYCYWRNYKTAGRPQRS